MRSHTRDIFRYTFFYLPEHFIILKLPIIPQSLSPTGICCYREIDYTTGIFQSIGFKEFHEYLLIPEEEKISDKGKAMFQKGVSDYIVLPCNKCEILGTKEKC
jgi:hypothetical protein